MGGPRESCVWGEGSGHGGCEWASPRFLAEPRNDRGMGRGGPRESCVRGEGSGHGGCEWASARFLAEPRNDGGYGRWGGHERRSYGRRGRALGMADVNGQVLDSSRSLGMTGGMGGGGATRDVRTGGGGGRPQESFLWGSREGTRSGIHSHFDRLSVSGFLTSPDKKVC